MAFFMSSASSFRWNVEVNQLLNCLFPIDKFCEEIIDGIPLGFFVSQNALKQLPVTEHTRAYRRYGKNGDPFNYTLIKRPILHNINVMIKDVVSDKETKSGMVVELRFFLPPGTYATNLVRQFFLSLNSVY